MGSYDDGVWLYFMLVLATVNVLILVVSNCLAPSVEKARNDSDNSIIGEGTPGYELMGWGNPSRRVIIPEETMLEAVEYVTGDRYDSYDHMISLDVRPRHVLRDFMLYGERWMYYRRHRVVDGRMRVSE